MLSIFPQIPDYINDILSIGQTVPGKIAPYDCPGPPNPAPAMNINWFSMFDA
jgi:hypothetical protein